MRRARSAVFTRSDEGYFLWKTEGRRVIKRIRCQRSQAVAATWWNTLSRRRLRSNLAHLTTKFTILPGTTTILTIFFPAICAATVASSIAAASIVA